MAGRAQHRASRQLLPPVPRHRRDLGQHFLVDQRVVARFIDSLDVRQGDLFVDLGAGAGAITGALLEAGARVVAVEVDPYWTEHLRKRFASQSESLKVVECDLRRFRFPGEPFRVAARWSFSITLDIDRGAFSPIPRIDAAVLRIERRAPPILTTWLADDFIEVLRPRWETLH